MLDRLKDDFASVILRVALATIVCSHGYFKLQLDSGAGWHPGLDPFVARLVAWGEFLCGLALLAGLLSRLAALGIGVIQAGAILLVTWTREFISVPDLFARKSEQGFRYTHVGYEYNFALLAMCLCVILLGSGLFSLDHLIWSRLFRPPAKQAEPLTPAAPGEAEPIQPAKVL